MGQSASKEGKKDKTRTNTDAIPFHDGDDRQSLTNNNNNSMVGPSPRSTKSSFAGGGDLAASQYVANDEDSLMFDREALTNKSVRQTRSPRAGTGLKASIAGKTPKAKNCPFCGKVFGKIRNIFRKPSKCEKCLRMFCKKCTTIYFDDSE